MAKSGHLSRSMQYDSWPPTKGSEAAVIREQLQREAFWPGIGSREGQGAQQSVTAGVHLRQTVKRDYGVTGAEKVI